MIFMDEVKLKTKNNTGFFKGQHVRHQVKDPKEHSYGPGTIKEFCNDQNFIQVNFEREIAMNPVVVPVHTLTKISKKTKASA